MDKEKKLLRVKVSLLRLIGKLHKAICEELNRTVSRTTIYYALEGKYDTPLAEFIREKATTMVAEVEDKTREQTA